MAETALAEYQDVVKIMREAGLSDEEIDAQLQREHEDTVEGLFQRLPQIRVDAPKSGDPFFYVRTDEEETVRLGQKIAIVLGEAHEFRSYFEDAESSVPICQAVWDVPIVAEPFAAHCTRCEYGRWGKDRTPPVCRQSVRVFCALAPETPEIPEGPNLFMLFFPPTSIKHFRAYKTSLEAEKKLLRMSVALLELSPQSRGDARRWAEIIPSFKRLTTGDEYKLALKISESYQSSMRQATQEEEPEVEFEAPRAASRTEFAPAMVEDEDDDDGLPF